MERKPLSSPLSGFFDICNTSSWRRLLSNDKLVNMGLNGYSLVKQKFCWEEIAKQTIQLYEYLLNGGEKPSFVYE